MTPFGLYSFYRVYRQLPKKKEFVRVKTEKFENIQTHKKKRKRYGKIFKEKEKWHMLVQRNKKEEGKDEKKKMKVDFWDTIGNKQ